MREAITIDLMYIEIIRECHKQLYADKFNNLDKTDTFLRRQRTPKLTQE